MGFSKRLRSKSGNLPKANKTFGISHLTDMPVSSPQCRLSPASGTKPSMIRSLQSEIGGTHFAGGLASLSQCTSAFYHTAQENVHCLAAAADLRSSTIYPPVACISDYPDVHKRPCAGAVTVAELTWRSTKPSGKKPVPFYGFGIAVEDKSNGTC